MTTSEKIKQNILKIENDRLVGLYNNETIDLTKFDMLLDSNPKLCLLTTIGNIISSIAQVQACINEVDSSDNEKLKKFINYSLIPSLPNADDIYVLTSIFRVLAS